MGSVFGEPAEEAPHSETFDGVVAWVDELHRRRGDDLLAVGLGKVEVTGDQGWTAGTGSQDFAANGGRSWQDDELGIEAYATYLPIHFFPEGHWRHRKPGWGIYVSEAGVWHVARMIEDGFVRSYGTPRAEDRPLLLRIAFEVLLRHEMEHFKVESFALSAELQRRKPLYVPYLMSVSADTYESDFCLEESLANATVLDSRVIKTLVHTLYPERKPKDWHEVLARALFAKQRYAYSNYDFRRDWHEESTQSRRRLVHLSNRPRRDAMNYLCNQIVTGEVQPSGDILPFYAFPPDNFFLRAESLVPVYVLKDLPEDISFIHFPTPTRTVWELFLRQIGFTPTDKGKGDHRVWERPGFDRITNNFHGKELDPNSFSSARRSLGITRKEFDQAVRDKHALGRLEKLDQQALQPLFA